jgi:muramidase (phage lysozyme)
MNYNREAFLTMIAVSEGTQHLGDRGYNVCVGNSLFYDYSKHPRKLLWIKRIGKYSSAAGRYQVLAKFYDYYKKALQLPDFSPASQDAIAIQLIKECKALADVDAGRFETAVEKCKSRWASLPGAGYGQHENTMEKLKTAYVNAGGKFDLA